MIEFCRCYCLCKRSSSFQTDTHCWCSGLWLLPLPPWPGLQTPGDNIPNSEYGRPGRLEGSETKPWERKYLICSKNQTPSRPGLPCKTEQQKPRVCQWHIVLHHKESVSEWRLIPRCGRMTFSDTGTSGHVGRQMLSENGNSMGTCTVWFYSHKKRFDQIHTHCLFCQLIMPSFGKTINQTYIQYLFYVHL